MLDKAGKCGSEPVGTWVSLGTAAAEVVARLGRQMRSGAATQSVGNRPPPPLNAAVGEPAAETGKKDQWERARRITTG